MQQMDIIMAAGAFNFEENERFHNLVVVEEEILEFLFFRFQKCVHL